MSEPGFIDLRIGHGVRGTAEDSVWPSFTDIMTVVVMIFLMALVVIMVRNNDLNQKLVDSIGVNDAIVRTNVSLSSQINSLTENLNLTQAEKDELGEKLLSTIARNNTLVETKASLEASISELEVLKASLTDENLALLAEKNRLTQANSLLANERDTLSADKSDLQQENESLISQSLALSKDRDRLAGENVQLKEENKVLDQQREELVVTRDNLDEDKVALQSEVQSLLEREQLLSTQLSAIERQFSQLQLDSGGEIDALSTRNLDLTGQLDQVNLRLAQLKLELDKQSLAQRNLTQELAKKEEEYTALQASEKTILEQRQELAEQLALKEQEYLALKNNEQSTLQRFSEASLQIEELAERIRERDRQISELRKITTQGSLRYTTLQEEYESLEEKYRSLVRAARSPAGKYIATVVFTRNLSGSYEYRFAEPGTSRELISREDLGARLQALKEQHGRNLYTKVVIPEDSDLSHDEAWRFTQEILNRYDYYYQPVEQ